jgi:KDO2-lipid IV(A) lauroyltransferase
MDTLKPPPRTFRQALARFWLARFFWLCAHAPGLLTAIRPVLCAAAFACSPSIRRGTRFNAALLLGSNSTPRQRDQLARRTLASFYSFCCDVGGTQHSTVEELLARVESVQGRETYLRARALRRGAILVTAHMGSFEVALAALKSMEENIHVLFRHDADDEFERLRSNLRRRLGVHEVSVDSDWTIWIKLRQALQADQVVVIQGDRVLPGQKGQAVPFLGGTMQLPASPIKLALASDAPIIPIFSVRTATGKIQLVVQEPIHVHPTTESDRHAPHPALLELAGVLQKQILAHPDQWLLLEPLRRSDI